METRVSYTLVGLFVILLSGAIVVGLFWLAAGIDDTEFYTYRVYTTDSVAGLSANSAVRYKGVAVGRVTYIGLDPDNPEQVELLLDIQKGTPIREGTIATLVSQGITGLANVELSGGTGTEVLIPTVENPVPVIDSGPSLVTRLEDAFNNLSRTLDRVMSEQNIDAFGATLANIRDVTDRLAQNDNLVERNLANLETFTSALADSADEIEGLIQNASVTLASTRTLAEDIQPAMAQVIDSAAAIETMAQSFQTTSNSVDRLVASIGNQVGQWRDSTSPRVNNLLAELNRLATTLQQFTRELDRNPRMFLQGRSQGRPGPGE